MHFSAMHILGNYFHLTTPLIYKRMIRVFITMAYSKAHALLLKMDIGTWPGGKQTHIRIDLTNKLELRRQLQRSNETCLSSRPCSKYLVVTDVW